eukprot:GSMAST32.ASY1.ANO1.270.1 assembled CDS
MQLGGVNSVAFHPNGNYLLSTSDDNTVKIWDLREGHVLYTLRSHVGFFFFFHHFKIQKKKKKFQKKKKKLKYEILYQNPFFFF